MAICDLNLDHWTGWHGLVNHVLCILNFRLTALQKNLCMYMYTFPASCQKSPIHIQPLLLFLILHFTFVFLKNTRHATLWQRWWSASTAFHQSLASTLMQNWHFSLKPFCQNKKKLKWKKKKKTLIFILFKWRTYYEV